MCDRCGCGDERGARVVFEPNRSLFQENRRLARANMEQIQGLGGVAINLIGSPGAGKTFLLERTISRLKDRIDIAVLEGDIETDRDARRIKGQGVPVVQLTTGGACHLNAALVNDGLRRLVQQGISSLDLLFIENVGNLVCPSDFDLGERFKVALLSVPEGSDKPAKYPALFKKASLLLITKMDLLPYFDFSVDEACHLAKEINPDIEIISLSAKTGQGMDGWFGWLKRYCVG